IIKVDLAVHAARQQRFHDDGAEPAPFRRRYERPLALGPAHGEGVAVGSPADVDAARIRRQRPVFPGIGGELVEREPDRLRGSRAQAQLGAVQGDTRTDEVGKVRELGTNQVLDLHTIPFVADEQVLIGSKRLDALGEALDEVFRTSGDSLVGNRVDDAEHILGPMIDLAHEEMLLLLALLAFGDVLNRTAEAHGPAFRPGALKISKSMTLRPADRAVSPPNPELVAVRLRIG